MKTSCFGIVLLLFGASLFWSFGGDSARAATPTFTVTPTTTRTPTRTPTHTPVPTSTPAPTTPPTATPTSFAKHLEVIDAGLPKLAAVWYNESDRQRTLKQPLMVSGTGTYDTISNKDFLVSANDVRDAVDLIQQFGINLIRVWPYQYSDNASPGDGHNIAPFQFANGKLELDGFSFTGVYDATWKARLDSMLSASLGTETNQDDVMILLTLFDGSGDINDGVAWLRSPWNAANNNTSDSGIAVIAGTPACGFPYMYLINITPTTQTPTPSGATATPTPPPGWEPTQAARLTEMQENYVKQMVYATGYNWNVIYEIMNEPRSGQGCGGEASIAQVLQWHQQVARWIREALDDMRAWTPVAGTVTPVPSHLIAVCDANDDDQQFGHPLNVALEADPAFDIFCWHGVAGGWYRDGYCNGGELSDYPCADEDAPTDHCMNIDKELSSIVGFYHSFSKFLIVDTDGTVGIGPADPYVPPTPTGASATPVPPKGTWGYSRDYDPNCWNWMNIALLSGAGFNTKEIVDFEVNSAEQDCTRQDDGYWYPTWPTPVATQPPHYLDGPYYSGVRDELTAIYKRPQIHLAGFGYSNLYPVAGQEIDIIAGQVDPYNAYGNGAALGIRLTEADDFGATSGWLPVTGYFDVDWELASSGVDLYSSTYSPSTVLAKGYYAARMALQTDPTATPAPGTPTCTPAPDDRWPLFTLYRSRVISALPQNSGNSSSAGSVEEVLLDALQQGGTSDLKQYVPLAESMEGFRDEVFTQTAPDTLENKPYIVAAGYYDTRIIDIYGGSFLAAAIVVFPTATPVPGKPTWTPTPTGTPPTPTPAGTVKLYLIASTTPTPVQSPSGTQVPPMEIAVELGPMLEPAGMEGSGVYFYATAIPRLPTPAGGDVTTLHLAIAAEDHSGRTAIWPGFLVNPVKVSSGPCRTFLIPFWQSGWGLETIFSYSNLPSSAAAATVQTDLYYYDNQAAEFDFFSAPPMWLDNGSANYLTTSDTNWYTIGDEFGAALVTVQYEDAPDDTDRFSAWAVAYADPSTGFPGLAISVPDSPAGPNTKHANLGSGRFPLSYWVNDGTETSYFLVYNSSTSLTDAIIRFEWQDGEGDGNLPATQAIVPPGEFRQIDPPSGVGVTYGMGDITVAFEGVPNQYNEVSIYSVVYGIMDIGGGQSMQVGYAVDLKRPSPPLPGTGAQEEFDIAIPFWQDGWDQHTVWSIYNSADSTSDSVTVSLKLYDASSTLVEESTSTVLEPGEGVVLDTQYDAWYELTANKLGYAYLHMVYADSPGREDVVSFWSAVYSVAADGTHAGYQVTSRDCAIRPHNLDPAVANYETRGFGEQTVAVPFWIEYDGTLPMHTFYSIWNSADSDHNVDITLHLRDYDNTESVSKVIASITPGTFQMIDTSNSYFDDLEGLSGVGEITIDFSGTPTADDRVFLWSCYYSAYQSVPLGFDIALQ